MKLIHETLPYRIHDSHITTICVVKYLMKWTKYYCSSQATVLQDTLFFCFVGIFFFLFFFFVFISFFLFFLGFWCSCTEMKATLEAADTQAHTHTHSRFRQSLKMPTLFRFAFFFIFASFVASGKRVICERNTIAVIILVIYFLVLIVCMSACLKFHRRFFRFAFRTPRTFLHFVHPLPAKQFHFFFFFTGKNKKKTWCHCLQIVVVHSFV